MIFWIWTGVLLMTITIFFRRRYSKFKENGVNNLPVLPVFGNMFKATCRIQHLTQFEEDLYYKFREDRFVGFYEFIKPVILLKDLELIKSVTVKDFEYFPDHRVLMDENIEPYFGSTLFSLKGQKWRDMRATLSPAFTSSKIRLMVPHMIEVGNQMVESLKHKLQEKGSDSADIDMKDLTTRFTNDVIATCAFGLKINSMAHENNDFYTMAKKASNFSFFQILKFFGFTSMPGVMKALKIKLFSEEVGNFFRHLVLDTIKNREDNNIVRNDMIQLLMEAKKGNLSHDSKEEDAHFAAVTEHKVGETGAHRHWTDNDLIGQAVIFLIAGFDTVATAMTFLIYELAINPDCQNRLYQEIMENEKKNGGFDYNSIQKMKYLDMVISELIRKWPPAIAVDRISVKSYNLGRPNQNSTKDYIIKKGQGVMIPIWCIHRDPRYYENPNKFDPERFSDENKHKIIPSAYMPFGNGPRNCIGSRFALCEIKVMVYKLLQHVEVMPCEKTCIPAVLSNHDINLRLKGGHWIKIRTRK